MPERVVLALVPDLMFATQIEEALVRLGYTPMFAPDGAALLARASGERPALILLDLAARGCDVPGLIGALKGDAATRAVPVIAFGPHLDVAAHGAARAAGADAVVANSKLAFDLAGVVGKVEPSPPSPPLPHRRQGGAGGAGAGGAGSPRPEGMGPTV